MSDCTLFDEKPDEPGREPIGGDLLRDWKIRTYLWASWHQTHGHPYVKCDDCYNCRNCPYEQSHKIHTLPEGKCAHG